MSSLKFGTSGLRGLVVDLVGRPSRDWTRAFIAHLNASPGAARELLVGRDLRASSPAIAAECLRAAAEAGCKPFDCGALPTPALALAAAERGAPAVMVTGSHIPDDRNGLKFYRPNGEITKSDEAGIFSAFESLAGADAAPLQEMKAVDIHVEAIALYRRRHLAFFPADALAGLRIGVYQQSTVARDLLTDLLSALGAEAVALGRSENFLPVDTEAHRPEDVAAIAAWAADGRFHAIVSADGDADRPLVADGVGRILRGDVVGLLTARHLAAQTLVTPVTSTSAIERNGFVPSVIRTRVGSPFVIEGMARTGLDEPVVGFEANGGFLLGSRVEREGRALPPLPTRDAMLPILCVLAAANAGGTLLSALVDELDAGSALADRLQNVPSHASEAFLARLAGDGTFAGRFFSSVGRVAGMDLLDGVRVRLEDGSIVHYRASGNAPELRCYVEASNGERAAELLDWGLKAASAELYSIGPKIGLDFRQA